VTLTADAGQSFLAEAADAWADPTDCTGATLADLASLRTATEWGWVRFKRAGPAAAFSRRDTLASGYLQAAGAARSLGFAPIVRPVGGRLVAYHEGALLLDVLGRHPSPAREIDRRFRAFGQAVASALRSVGVDARLGAVPGEYCPGRFSVNAGGRAKLAGTGQRVTRGSFLLSAMVLVNDPEPIRSVLCQAYPFLGHDWDPNTLGCVSEQVGSITPNDVRAALLDALADFLPLELALMSAPPDADLADPDMRVPLGACWEFLT
jgi:octanoyl-[GcvH]:protein N-octanoyltransferase